MVGEVASVIDPLPVVPFDKSDAAAVVPAVTCPLALKVILVLVAAVAMFGSTVINVPAEVVTSPVSAGNWDAPSTEDAVSPAYPFAMFLLPCTSTVCVAGLPELSRYLSVPELTQT